MNTDAETYRRLYEQERERRWAAENKLRLLRDLLRSILEDEQ